MKKILDQKITDNYSIYNGDCIEILNGLPDNSIGYTISSPPFASLYTYSNSERDLGNCKDYESFWESFSFLFQELYRVTKPGRSVSFHCIDLPTSKESDGYIGMVDFVGDIIRAFQKAGFIYHSRVVIWKDPLIEVTRTKALGLQYKQLVKDSSMCRQGIPDTLVTFRKPGVNEEFVKHERDKGLGKYAGASVYEPSRKDGDEKYAHRVWQKYASPVWMDINQTDVLSFREARDKDDEKHICCLQLQVIERGVVLWSNEGDIVLDPFGGVGSTGYVANKLNRKAVMCELKESYFKQMKKHMNTINERKNREFFAN